MSLTYVHAARGLARSHASMSGSGDAGRSPRCLRGAADASLRACSIELRLDPDCSARVCDRVRRTPDPGPGPTAAGPAAWLAAYCLATCSRRVQWCARAASGAARLLWARAAGGIEPIEFAGPFHVKWAACCSHGHAGWRAGTGHCTAP